MSFEIKKASRVGLRPLIGFYSESGCGKTYSALLLARGFVGPSGKIVIIDTESGRGSLYADVLAGGYETLEVGSPFSPSNAVKAIEAVEQSGANIGILDSASHFWEGIGGVLDMAAQNEEKSGKPGLHCWRTPKLEHAKFMLKLLQSSIPWIVCLRAKYKSRQVKVDGKTQIIKDDATSPQQAEDFIFELTAHAEILQNHSIILTKCSHPELRKCFPADKTTPITIEHGEMIAKWCHNPTSAPASSKSKASNSDALKRELWTITKKVHGENRTALEQYLWDEAIISDTECLAELTEKRLEEVVKECRKKLK